MKKEERGITGTIEDAIQTYIHLDEQLLQTQVIKQQETIQKQLDRKDKRIEHLEQVNNQLQNSLMLSNMGWMQKRRFLKGKE